MREYIFYYWLENVNNSKETRRITSLSWLGDINEVIGGIWKIIDYTVEEAVM